MKTKKTKVLEVTVVINQIITWPGFNNEHLPLI